MVPRPCSRPMLILCFVAVRCSPIRFPFYAWFATTNSLTSGATPAAPGFIPQQTTVELPYMLHPGVGGPPPNISIAFERKKTPAQTRLHLPKTGSLLPVLPKTIWYSEISWGTSTAIIVSRVDLSYWLFDERGGAAAIRKACSSTAQGQGPDRLTVLFLPHIGEQDLIFMTELFNLSVVGFDMDPVIWKNSVIIPIFKAGKPRDQGRSYRHISLLWPSVKILEWLLLPSIVEALGTRPSQHGFKPRHSTASAMLPISARVVSGFNQQKPCSRTIAMAVDISFSLTASSSRWSTTPNSDTIWLDGLWHTYAAAAGRSRASTNINSYS